MSLPRISSRLATLAFLAVAALAFDGCGGSGKGANEAPNASVDVDGDPVALLPSGALALANLDAKTFYAAGALGAQLAQAAERLVPVGDEAGFVPARDTDRVVLALYVSQGVDAAAIVSGRFDQSRIAQVAANNMVTKSGSAIVTTQYAGHAVYTLGTVGFTVLSSKTVLAGTDWGIRRTLDKITSGHAARAFKPWMLDNCDSKGTPLAFSADFTNQPVVSAAMGTVALPFLTGLQTARVIANFKDPGMQVAARFSYGDPTQAASAAQQIHAADDWNRVFGSVLGKVSDLDVAADGADVTAAATLDDSSLRALVGMALHLLPAAR